jgi:hypothetical protein
MDIFRILVRVLPRETTEIQNGTDIANRASRYVVIFLMIAY